VWGVALLERTIMSEQQTPKRPRKRRGRGEGAIFQRPDGTWSAIISLGFGPDGKRLRRQVYAATKKEVQDKLRNLQTDHALGRLTDVEKFTLEDWLTLWLENTIRVKTGATTYDRYKLVVRKQIGPYLGEVRLDKLTKMHIMQLYLRLEKAGESPRMRQMAGTVLYGALRYAVAMGRMVSNPCQDVGRPKVQKREMLVYNAAQVQAFLQAAESDRLYALYVTALESGMRQGELFGLQWPDVDFDGGSLQVQRTLQELRGEFTLKPPKTAAGRRRIELSAFTLAVLNGHRQRMLAEGCDVRTGQVFCDERGGFLRKSNVSRRSFRSIMARAGLPRIRFHDLRHTAATLLLMAGENVKVVSERLGHEDIQITLTTYAHVLPTMQKGAAEKMNRILGSGSRVC
jgi:integrase